MVNMISIEELAYQNSGRFLSWTSQESGTVTVNGAPTIDVSGVEVSENQVVKIGITPNGGATLNFRIWVQYVGLAKYVVVDQSERSGIDTAWTQEIDVSGAARIYLEVTSIDIGSYDIDIGRGVGQFTEFETMTALYDASESGSLSEGQVCKISWTGDAQVADGSILTSWDGTEFFPNPLTQTEMPLWLFESSEWSVVGDGNLTFDGSGRPIITFPSGPSNAGELRLNPRYDGRYLGMSARIRSQNLNTLASDQRHGVGLFPSNTSSSTNYTVAGFSSSLVNINRIGSFSESTMSYPKTISDDETVLITQRLLVGDPGNTVNPLVVFGFQTGQTSSPFDDTPKTYSSNLLTEAWDPWYPTINARSASTTSSDIIFTWYGLRLFGGGFNSDPRPY